MITWGEARGSRPGLEGAINEKDITHVQTDDEGTLIYRTSTGQLLALFKDSYLWMETLEKVAGVVYRWGPLASVDGMIAESLAELDDLESGATARAERIVTLEAELAALRGEDQ